MTNYIILCDLHLSERNEEVVFNILSYVATKMRKDKNARLAILGDFYDTVYKDGQIDARLQQRAYDFFVEHFNTNTLYMIPGNHDMYNGYFHTAISIFAEIATIYDEPSLDQHGILWLPYREGGYPRAKLRQFKRQGAKICFTHNDFKYLSTRKNNMSRNGMEPNAFDGMKVYNGHYHYPNVQENVTCVGSQYAVHKAETYDQKVLYTIYPSVDQWKAEPIRFGRRDFTYPIDYCRDLAEQYWLPYAEEASYDVVPPPTFPTIQDTLIIEYNDGDDLSLSFLDNIVNCPIVMRKVSIQTPNTTMSNAITLDTTLKENIDEAVKHLYTASPESLNMSLKEISDEICLIFHDFNLQNYDHYYDKRSMKEVNFERIAIDNFCGVHSLELKYDKGTTKVEGVNGVGKTIQYPTALLYVLTGVMDSRFSDERLVLNDMRTRKKDICVVMVQGTVDGKKFLIKRTYNGKKSTIQFKFNDEEVNRPTMKQVQYEICSKMFNVFVAKNTCPSRFLHKLLLQRLVWKQGGKDSNLLKLNKDTLQTLFLETMQKGEYMSFLKFAKSKMVEQKKRLDKQIQVVKKVNVLIQERKEVSEQENVGLEAWNSYRRITLNECKQQLSVLEANPFTPPETWTSEVVTNYVNYHTSVKTLQQQIEYMVDSKEGLRWNPELTLNRLTDSYDILKDCDDALDAIKKKMDKYVRCVEVVKYIINVFYNKISSIMEGYDSGIKFSDVKSQKLLDGTPMKYLSGGQYEERCLQAYLDFQKFVEEYGLWRSNLLILDEPGTAMSTTSLQEFVKKIKMDKCNVVITHKPIKCPIHVILN